VFSYFDNLNTQSLISRSVLFQIRVPYSTGGCLASQNTTMLHMMMPVGISLILAPIRDEMNVVNGHDSKFGLPTIGDGIRYDSNAECG